MIFLKISDTVLVTLIGIIPVTLTAVAGLIISLKNNKHLNEASRRNNETRDQDNNSNTGGGPGAC